MPGRQSVKFSELFTTKRRFLQQAVIDEDIWLRAEVLQRKLGHKTKGMIWRAIITAGLCEIEKAVSKGRRMAE